MWVRTQDKEILMKVDNINLGIDVDTKKPNRLFTFVDGVTTSFTLGKYKSKERALEVLDEIQVYLENNYLSINDMPQHNNGLIANGLIANGLILFPNNKHTVYQMPKEWLNDRWTGL